MWVFTRHGFFSAVQATDDAELVVVRARSRADIAHLHGWLRGLGAPSEVITYAVSDYPWRTITTKAAWALYVHAAAADIDYGNYKGAVAETNPRRASTYHGVWDACLAIEDEPDADTGHHRNPYAPQQMLAVDDEPAAFDISQSPWAHLADPFHVGGGS